MLIGLVAKNGILIVEFANQTQEAGEDKMSAIKDAALQRLRPILMTRASPVLGLIPLAFATGAGCNQRIAMDRYIQGDLSGFEVREAQKSLLDAEERILSLIHISY